MERKISGLSQSQKDELSKIFGVSERQVYKALSFGTNSDLARKIRTVALEKGGQIILTIPEYETIHDAKGMMSQIFPNGAKIEVNKNTGDTVVIHKDKVRAKVHNISIRQLYALQEFAAGI